MLTATTPPATTPATTVRERDPIEILKAQILELLHADQDVRAALLELLQDDKTRRLFI